MALSLAISTSISFAVTGDKNKQSQIGDEMNSLAVWVTLGIELARLLPYNSKKFIKYIGYWFLVNCFTIIYHYFVDMFIDMGFNLNNLFNCIPDSFTIIFMNWDEIVLCIMYYVL